MKKKSKKPLIIWGIIIAVLVAAIVIIISIANKEEETPTFQIEGTTLVKYNGNEENVVIPKEVKTIGKIAFKGKGQIKTISFESGSELTTIGQCAFEGCSSLTSIELPSTVTSIESYAFVDCLSLTKFTMPDNVTHIGASVFESCSELSTIELSDSLETIGERAFAECRALDIIYIPSEVKAIGPNAFYNCVNLLVLEVASDNEYYLSKDNVLYTKDEKELIVSVETGNSKIIIPSTVEKIHQNAFFNAEKVKEIIVHDGVKEIETNAFSGCVNIEKVTVPFIGSSVEDNGIFVSIFNSQELKTLKQITITKETKVADKAFQRLASVEQLTLAPGTDSIGEYAFAGCAAISSINNFPTTLREIGRYTFRGCTKLSNEFVASHLTDSVEIIYEGAYADCVALTNVVVPQSVKHLDKGVFSGCTALKEITLPFVGMGYELDELTNQVSNEFNESTLFGYIFTTNTITDNTDIVPSSLESVTITSDYDIIDKAFINCSNLTTVNLPTTVKNIGVESFRNCKELVNFPVPTSLENIGASAFEQCEKLKQFALPASVTELSESVFSSCKALEELDITYVTYIGKLALFNCENLAVVISGDNPNYEVVDSVLYSKGQEQLIRYPAKLKNKTFEVPAAVKVICEGAFQKCKSLKEIVINETVEEIELNAFVSCEKLENITLPFIGNLPETAENRNSQFKSIFGGLYPENLFVTITGGTVVDNDAFSNVAFVYHVSLGPNFTEIGLSAFENCSILSSIEFDSSSAITKIGSRAFSKCSQLGSLSIPSTVVEIGDFAFADCDQVTSVSFPKGLDKLGVGAFKNWSSLTTVNIDEDNENYQVKDNAVLSKDGKTLLFYIAGSEAKEYTVSSEVQEIYSYAFSGAHSLENVVISDSVTSLSEGLFYNCSSLVTVALPTSAEVIPYSMFENCYSLTTVSNSDGVVVIEGRAFKGCALLTTAPISSKTTEIGENAFEGCAAIKEVVIPSAITEIKKASFKDCTNLEIVTFNDEITVIGDSAFYNCGKLGKYVLPAKLEIIGQYAFANTCTNRTLFGDKTKLDESGNPVLDENGKEVKELCIVTLIIPETVTEIGFRAFYTSLFIDEVYVPATVKVIGDGGLDISANTSIYSDAITVTKNEETLAREVIFPETWEGFKNIQPSTYGKGEFTFDPATGKITLVTE